MGYHTYPIKSFKNNPDTPNPVPIFPRHTHLEQKLAVTENETKKSPPSDPVEFTTTKKIRFIAEKFVNSSKKIDNENVVDVPLTKSNGSYLACWKSTVT